MTLNEIPANAAPAPTGRPVGLEHLSLYSEPASVFVNAAVDAGANSVCLSVNHPDIVDDRARTDLVHRLSDTDLSVTMGDGFLLDLHGAAHDRLEASLDVLADVGARYANVCVFEPDSTIPRRPDLVAEHLATFCERANARAVGVLIEFTPLSHVPTLAAAVELIDHLQQPNLAINVDTLHLFRAGEGPADIAAIAPELFGYVQISDGLLGDVDLDTYLTEAVYDRMLPGDGEFPLTALLDALPSDITVSAEVPLQRLAATLEPQQRAAAIIAATRRCVGS